ILGNWCRDGIVAPIPSTVVSFKNFRRGFSFSLMEYPFSAREYNKSSGAIGEIIFYSVSKNLNFHGVYGVRCNKSMRSSVLRSRKFTISMKYLLLLMLISFLSIVDAQNPQLSILNTVLTDSTIARYVSV